MDDKNLNVIPSLEDVARILSKEWFVKGDLQHTAFKLAMANHISPLIVLQSKHINLMSKALYLVIPSSYTAE